MNTCTELRNWLIRDEGETPKRQFQVEEEWHVQGSCGGVHGTFSYISMSNVVSVLKARGKVLAYPDSCHHECCIIKYLKTQCFKTISIYFAPESELVI